VTIAVRDRASPVLVCAADPEGRTAGACSGDSGAPIWPADGEAAVAIATWAQGPNDLGYARNKRIQASVYFSWPLAAKCCPSY